MSDEATLAADEDRQLTEEQQKEKLEQEEAQTGFTTGFAKVKGGEPKETEAEEEEEIPEKKETEAVEKTASITEPEKQPDPWESVPKVVREKLESLEALPNRIRNIEGHVGGLKTTIQSMSATAKAAATKQGAESPTDEQVAAAVNDSEEWAKLREEYPEWAGGFEKQMTVIENRILQKVPQVDLNPINNEVAQARGEVQQLRQTIPLYVKHPTWESDVKTPEFAEFAYRDGPTQEERAQQDQLEQTDPQKAIEFSNELIRKYPQWWADRGSLMASDSPLDAIKLMDKFSETAKAASPPASVNNRREKNQQRLENATTPKGAGSEVQKGVSDEEAFRKGFKKARG